MRIKYLGHSSVFIETAGKKIYINPMPGVDSDKKIRKIADLILISSLDNSDYHIRGVLQVRGDDTRIVSTREVAKLIDGCEIVNVGDILTMDYLSLKIVLAKTGQSNNSHFGFLIRVHEENQESIDKVIYYTGTTVLINEMHNFLNKIDVLLCCIGGKYMMRAKDAVQIVNWINPKIAIPTHYGTRTAGIDDAELFKELVESNTQVKTEVKILTVDELLIA